MIISGQRRPELDGVRAIAVSLVIAGHAMGTLASAEGNGLLALVLGNAALGVQMFFVLSGFLITSLLLNEREATGTLRFGSFYQRRLRRIMPVFLAYVLAIVLLQGVGLLQIDASHYWAALTQTWNYQVLWKSGDVGGSGSWYFGHYWSLALEEQFYLVWPLVVWALTRRSQIRLAVGVVVLMPVLRLLWYAVFPGHRGNLGMFFHTAADSMVWGSILALFLREWPEKVQRIAHSNMLLLLVAVLVVFVQPMMANLWHGAWTLPIGMTLNAGGCALLLAGLLFRPSWQQWLNWRPLVFLGTISYSVYIWQQLFLAPGWAQGPKFPLLVALPALLVVAWASWRWIEQPFRHRGHQR